MEIMDFQENYSLQRHNTLGLQQQTRFFVRVHNEQELLNAHQFAKEKKLPMLMIGEGSNLVLSRDYPGLVIQNAIKGINVVAEDADTITLAVGGGENWHQLVCHTLKQHWFGLENLALIPGTVGAAPVQNIGAYGVEICSSIVGVRALDTHKRTWHWLDKPACQFAYRDSLFKQQPGHLLISQVQLCLLKKPAINIHYQALRSFFVDSGVDIATISPQQVCDAVMAIRRSRLPDPAVTPNAGSFFKNPIVPLSQYQQLLEKFPAMVSYPSSPSQRKLAAAWLIDQAGWKGVQDGRVAVHDQQALVLVNRGHASGAELLALATKIAADVKMRYGVELEIEPTVV